MRLSSPHLLVPTAIVLASAIGGPVAQAAAFWIPVSLPAGVTGDIRMLISPVPGGYQVYFKNFGSALVHFGFYVEGPQTENDVPTNGRIHLKTGNVAGPLIIQSPNGDQSPVKMHVLDVTVGEADAPATSAL